jgi:hypothetical protein
VLQVDRDLACELGSGLQNITGYHNWHLHRLNLNRLGDRSVMVALIFLLIFLLISTSMPSCVKDCNRNFANDAALSRHRKACPVLQSVRQRSQDIRRAKGGGESFQNATALLTRKQRLQVSDMVVFRMTTLTNFTGTIDWCRFNLGCYGGG